ncbi:MAG TPA: amidohydrolase family protein [Armatimonadota bacterium]|nr:amidohydrolase family protein [Armatimonadota bacterium]
MPVSLFDVQCGFGGATPGCRDVLSADELVAEMARLDIARALVRIVPSVLESDGIGANARLYADCARFPERLLPCPIVIPNGGRDVPPEDEQLDEHIRRGARAIVLRPKTDYWSLAPWASGALLTALEERHLPTLCMMDELSLDDVAAIAERHATLPLIIAGVDYRQQRTLLPLLETFPNTYLSTGFNYCVHQGIEQCVAVVGAQRLLFGTGYPSSDWLMPAITYLMYADISTEDKQRIGMGNLERLLAEVQR